MTPSRQEMIEDIRRAAIARNPEILEPKSGWRFMTAHPDMIWRAPGQTVPEDARIIGRPLTLADILEVIKKFHGNMFVDECGHFVKPKRKEFTYNYVTEGSTNITWNLRLPFEEQSDATILFIHGLVKNV